MLTVGVRGGCWVCPSSPRSARVTDINVDGDSATAKVADTGSIFDGQTLDVALVKEGDQWKLDEFKGFEDFNKDAMIAAFRQQLSQEPGSTPQAVDCIVSQFQRRPTRRSRPTSLAAIRRPRSSCSPPAGSTSRADRSLRGMEALEAAGLRE